MGFQLINSMCRLLWSPCIVTSKYLFYLMCIVSRLIFTVWVSQCDFFQHENHIINNVWSNIIFNLTDSIEKAFYIQHWKTYTRHWICLKDGFSSVVFTRFEYWRENHTVQHWIMLEQCGFHKIWVLTWKPHCSTLNNVGTMWFSQDLSTPPPEKCRVK